LKCTDNNGIILNKAKKKVKMETKLNSIMKEVEENIKKMLVAGGYGKVEIEMKNSQVFIDTTYKKKVDLKSK